MHIDDEKDGQVEEAAYEMVARWNWLWKRVKTVGQY